MKTKKSKLFKTISFSSLALLMGIAGTMAFAPLGTSPSVASANEMVDQINTKADGENIKYAPSALGLDPENDPVIYTTESGLEIKYGGLDLNASLGSGPLKGYPYFTMGTYSSKNVNWIIIGQATDKPLGLGPPVSFLFSNWTSLNEHYSNKNYFSNNILDTTTPAGSAINTETPSKSYVVDSTNYGFITSNSEIPSGCVLAISECTLGTAAFNNSTTNSNFQGSTQQTYMNNLYQTNLNLSDSQKALIQPTNLKNRYGNTSDVHTASTSSGQYLFPLAATTDTNQNFCYPTYLSTPELRKAYSIGTTTVSRYWTRTGGTWRGDALFVNLAGEFTGDDSSWLSDVNCNNATGMRPSCIIKL